MMGLGLMGGGITVGDFAQRLRQARLLKGITQQNLASQLSISRSTLANWETGRTTPDPHMIHTLARALGTTTDSLLAPGLGRSSRAIPIIETLSDSKPLQPVGYEPTDEQDIDGDQTSFFYLVVQEESMLGEGIFPGDLVLVHEQTEVDYGNVAVVAIDNGKPTIKRVYMSDDNLILQSSNPAYPPLVFSGTDLSRVKIIGKVKVVKRTL